MKKCRRLKNSDIRNIKNSHAGETQGQFRSRVKGIDFKSIMEVNSCWFPFPLNNIIYFTPHPILLFITRFIIDLTQKYIGSKSLLRALYELFQPDIFLCKVSNKTNISFILSRTILMYKNRKGWGT